MNKHAKKISVVVLLLMAVLCLILSVVFDRDITGVKERKSDVVSHLNSELKVKELYAFPQLIPLDRKSGLGDLYVWSSYNDSKLKFVFYTKDVSTSNVGNEPWQCDGVELYLSKSETDDIFYQIISPFNGQTKFYKYGGSFWSDKNKDGMSVISHTVPKYIPWEGTEVNIEHVEGAIAITIDSSIDIGDTPIIQIIHNSNGGTTRNVLSLHELTKHEQDRRGWTKLIKAK